MLSFMSHTPNTELVPCLRELYSPQRIIEHDIAVSVALQTAIVVVDGLTNLCRQLRKYQLHPWFAEGTHGLQQQYQAASRESEICTRVSGGVGAALWSMCTMSNLHIESLAALPTDSFIGPLVYLNGYQDRYMAAGDLAVYRDPECTNI